MIVGDNKSNLQNGGAAAAAQKKKKKKPKKKKAQVATHYDSDTSDDSDNELQYLGSPRGLNPESNQSETVTSKVIMSSYEGNHLNDPVTLTIDLVVSKSNFSRECVTNCVNRMWDEGLKYDDPEAVLRELRAEEDSRVRQRADYDELLDGKLDSLTRKKSPDSALPAATKVEHKKTKVAVATPTVDFAQPTLVTETKTTAPTKSTTSADTSAAKGTVPTAAAPATEMSLSQRLEMAAAHPDISEAILALVSWCKIVGDSAPRLFFRDDCSALEIMLQGLCDNPLNIHDSVIKTRFTEFFSLVLPMPSPPNSHPQTDADAVTAVASLVGSIESVLGQVGAAHSLKPAAPARTAAPGKGTTSKYCPLALRMGATIRTVHKIYEKERERIAENGSIYAIDEEILSMTAAAARVSDVLATTGAGKPSMKEKFELREFQHEILQLQLKKLEAIAIKQRAPPSTAKADVHVGGPPADYASLENAIFSSSGDSRRHIDTMKTQSSSSRGFYDRILSDHEAKVAPYRAKLEKSSQTWTALQQQQAYLQQQLKAVEAEMAAEQSRTAALQSALATLQTDHEKQIGALNSSQSHVLDALEKDKQMRGLIDSVRAMESVVDDVVLIGLRSVGTRSDGVLSSRLPSVPSESLIASFLAYAASEAACVDILAKRVCLMKEKSVHLHREVAEYKNLGMQSLATEIAQSIGRIEENTAEDVGALRSLQDSVCAALAQLHAVIRNPSLIRSMPYTSLRDIACALSSAGVSVRPELTPYAQMPPEGSSPPSTTPAAPTISNSQSKPASPPASTHVSTAGATPAAASAQALPPRAKKGAKGGAKEDKAVAASAVAASAQTVAVPPPPGLSNGLARPAAPVPSAIKPTAPAPAKSSWAGWGRPDAVKKPVGSLAEIQAEQARSANTSVPAAVEEKKSPEVDAAAATDAEVSVQVLPAEIKESTTVVAAAPSATVPVVVEVVELEEGEIAE